MKNPTENVLYTWRSVSCLVENPTENVLYARRSVVCLVANHADKVLPDALRAACSCIPEMSCIPKMSYIPDALSSAWWRTQLKMSYIPDALSSAWSRTMVIKSYLTLCGLPVGEPYWKSPTRSSAVCMVEIPTEEVLPEALRSAWWRT